MSLELSNYAVVQAAEDWDSEEAMIRLGGKEPYNSITINGSNYSLSGGVIDGNGRAKAVSIDSGRETAVRNVSIKHAKVGIHIKHGANSGSSDADISSVNIVGTGGTDSVGVLVEGYDNTFTNMRIANVFIGVDLRSAGNSLRNSTENSPFRSRGCRTASSGLPAWMLHRAATPAARTRSMAKTSPSPASSSQMRISGDMVRTAASIPASRGHPR